MNDICVRFSSSELDELVEALSLLEGTFASSRLQEVFTRLRYAVDCHNRGIQFSQPFGFVLVERWFSWNDVELFQAALSLLRYNNRLKYARIDELETDEEVKFLDDRYNQVRSFCDLYDDYFDKLLLSDDNYVF